ncbi:DUF1471 domain-containing protein [Salmonella enterica]|nr:DUF1471 domain-containing protein [Salmonella enterica]EBW0192305.1 DUF1471 domain-containing protein [Salmonella enterica subsp. enterica serovar Norwich]EBW0200387.1 DUF1471 domain-containing protein [Salmonella enterica subsp. enterica serovar Senftenberg]EDW8245901.1 DUF1471 domain-containing protein [Salmonella enterica subsp. enterica serovar Javiana]EEE0783168.1 DUF1471 domain-containing protein [Salmonella enterica subsp. enterica serovar 6,7:-:-]
MTRSFIALVLLLAINKTASAATEIRDSEKATMKEKLGSVSVNIKNGTFNEATRALSQAADEKGASFFHITSLERAGMSSDIRATAVVYK